SSSGARTVPQPHHHPLHPLLFLYSSRRLLHPHSFPTRRSSDLVMPRPTPNMRDFQRDPLPAMQLIPTEPKSASCIAGSGSRWKRSEEHTSELQSRFDLVCRLLLEKKKTMILDHSRITISTILRD